LIKMTVNANVLHNFWLIFSANIAIERRCKAKMPCGPSQRRPFTPLRFGLFAFVLRRAKT
jgi:hypothetical protein